MKTEKTVDAYIDKHKIWQKELTTLRSILLEFPFEENIKWQFPVYSMDGKNLISIVSTKAAPGLWFFQGGLLEDSAKLLKNAQEGKTKAMRQWKFKDGKLASKTLIKNYIKEAISNHKAGKEIKAAKPNTKPVIIHPLLRQEFKKNAKLKSAFNAVSKSKQREFADYINDAKLEKTKLSRLSKIIPLILKEKGLNDKYK